MRAHEPWELQEDFPGPAGNRMVVIQDPSWGRAGHREVGAEGWLRAVREDKG